MDIGADEGRNSLEARQREHEALLAGDLQQSAQAFETQRGLQASGRKQRSFALSHPSPVDVTPSGIPIRSADGFEVRPSLQSQGALYAATTPLRLSQPSCVGATPSGIPSRSAHGPEVRPRLQRQHCMYAMTTPLPCPSHPLWMQLPLAFRPGVHMALR